MGADPVTARAPEPTALITAWEAWDRWCSGPQRTDGRMQTDRKEDELARMAQLLEIPSYELHDRITAHRRSGHDAATAIRKAVLDA